MTEEPHYKKLEARGEELYEELYGTGRPHGILSEIKECFEAAIAAAENDALAAEARRLRLRLEHIVTVYRHQFTDLPRAHQVTIEPAPAGVRLHDAFARLLTLTLALVRRLR
ncbi:MAG TPA: hypothetical protein VKR55_31675 [Bradyrhizobium sp.]|uniref:hypothetical protein n=1 Tax=Bradyrhizobium sp. TaxID=376 RepID=UPI002B76871B|nr:hypothetical protein [Bradyrhizobium sp.]HLZ06692.1 hypothetical protein [Bradyrhizobium sp.]